MRPRDPRLRRGCPGLAEIRQGTMTRRSTAGTAAEGHGPRKRDAVWSRNPPSPDQQGWRRAGARLGRHGADHASRGAPVVGPPSRSRSYACGVPPRIWRGNRRKRVGALLTRLTPLLQQAFRGRRHSPLQANPHTYHQLSRVAGRHERFHPLGWSAQVFGQDAEAAVAGVEDVGNS